MTWLPNLNIDVDSYDLENYLDNNKDEILEYYRTKQLNVNNSQYHEIFDNFLNNHYKFQKIANGIESFHNLTQEDIKQLYNDLQQLKVDLLNI